MDVALAFLGGMIFQASGTISKMGKHREAGFGFFLSLTLLVASIWIAIYA
jgi:hypothetical protein